MQTTFHGALGLKPTLNLAQPLSLTLALALTRRARTHARDAAAASGLDCLASPRQRGELRRPAARLASTVKVLSWQRRLDSAKLGSYASSGRAWRLRAARDTQGERPATGRPTTALGARANRRQSHPFYRL